MKLTIATIISVSALVAAAPTNIRQTPQDPDTVYGVDPSKSFYMTAYTYTTDAANSYTLQPFYIDYLGSILGLQAVRDTLTTNASAPHANFTLRGNHYGTQLYAYAMEPCTSNESCDESLVQWSNHGPTTNSLLTFHEGVNEPPFGGLAFYGKYSGGDFEAGEYNYLLGADDTDFTQAFTVCDWEESPSVQVIAYHGTNSSCVPVIVLAYQTGGFS